MALTRSSGSTSLSKYPWAPACYTEDEYLFPAMQAGAQGYLLKDVEPEDLVSAIRAAVRGQATLHPRVAARLVQGVDQTGDDALADLSERELEILMLMAAGLSNQQIADRLIISLSTVKNHVHNIIDKLEAKGRTQAVAQARELKLI